MIMDEHLNVKELLERLSEEDIVIYGTGHVAHKFYKALKLHNMEQRVVSFVVSSSVKDEENIEGVAVRTVEWLEKNQGVTVCAAVHEALKTEIIDNIRSRGIDNYIWIYPYLYELLLGNPIKTGQKVDVIDIVNTCKEDYRIAIRHMAIEQYLGKNSIGFGMYVRAQALHSCNQTARERLTEFCKLIDKWQTYGYDEHRPVFINSDYEIIDGTHRVALAVYYHMKQVTCDIFPNHISVSKLHGKEAMLTKEELLKGGFRPDEIELLDGINSMIRGIYYE